MHKSFRAFSPFFYNMRKFSILSEFIYPVPLLMLLKWYWSFTLVVLEYPLVGTGVILI